MRFRVRYGRATWVDDDRFSWRPERVVDDLFAMRPLPAPPAATHIAMPSAYLLERYKPFLQGDDVEPLRADAAAAREEFLAAIDSAQRGQLAPALAVHAARVTSLGGGEMDAPDVVAFAAWALGAVLQKGPVRVESCGLCRRPWISDGGDYCARPVPGYAVAGGEESAASTIVEAHGQVTVIAPLRTCREYEAQSRFYKQHGDFHRHRKSLYERMRRGTIEESAYHAWLLENRPGPEGKTWTKFQPSKKKGQSNGKN